MQMVPFATSYMPTPVFQPQLGRSVTIDHAASLLGVSRRTIYYGFARAVADRRTIGGSRVRCVARRLVPDPMSLSRSSQPPFVPTEETTMTLQPTDARHTAPQGVFRSTSQCFTTFVLALALVLVATSADAQRRARLSSDLQAHLDSGATAAVDIIVGGTPDSISLLAARHGLAVKKTLRSGAVLTATPAALESLAADAEVDAVSADALVRSQMALTTSTTGADAAWSGLISELGETSGRGVGVAIIDSGIAAHPALAGRVVANIDFTAAEGRGADGYGHGTHIAGIVAGGGFRQGVQGSASGMAPGAHLLNLKVLGADGSGSASNVIEASDWAIENRQRMRFAC
jgi:serine protease AprX